jgi:hypothetical protein
MVSIKMKLSIEALLLATILLIGIAYPLHAVNGSVNSLKVSKSAVEIDVIAQRYLCIFGYSSDESLQKSQSLTELQSGTVNGDSIYYNVKNGKITSINVQNSLKLLHGSMQGYSYNGKFTSDDGKDYYVAEGNFTTVNGNRVTTILNQTIIGSINYNMSSILIKTIEPNIISEQVSTSVKFFNSSGNYYFLSKSSIVQSLNDSNIFNETAVINENIYTPIGQTTLYFTPDTQNSLHFANGTEIRGDKVTLILPNGTVIDPDAYQFSNGDRNANGDALYGWWVWWDEGSGEPGLSILEDILSNLNGVDPFSLFISICEDTLSGLGYLYVSDMADIGGYITMQYWEFVMIDGILPWYAEAGYYTDKTLTQGNLGDWYFMPLWDTSISQANIHPHIDEFPTNFADDPPLSVLAYDDSSSTFFDGVPFYINSYYFGITSSTVDLQPGTYTIAVPIFGSFAYFDVGGTHVYSNSVTITLGDDPETIVAHYSSRPVTTLTVSAYGAYFGNTLNPDVYIDDVNYGPAPVSIQVTEGYHYVSVDTYTWDPYWNCMASLNYMYNYYTSTIYYNGQPVPITSDTWIAASYIP